MPRAAKSQSTLEVHPLTPERWPDLVRLFGPSGADGGCWCMYWRLTQTAYAQSSRTLNQAALKARVDQGQPPGLLAYRQGEPAGWCGLSPRQEFARLQRSRHFATDAAAPAWVIVCFFVQREQRGQGVARALLRAAVEYAVGQGARSLEGYPVNTGAEPLQAQAAFPGTTRMFRAAGFRLVAITPAMSGGQQRAIMRYEVKD
jgi:GNAT superfamily N-acetyltransferase